MQTQTNVDKLKAHTLAPSASLDEVSLLAVAGSLLGAKFSDAKAFRKFVCASAYQETTFSTSSSQPEKSSPSVFNTVHGMHQNEASGVPLLAVFVLNIIKKINKQFVDLHFSADMEYTVMDS
jgi:hypothetical protein